MPEGSEVTFEGEADESPDHAPGDVIVRVKSKKLPGAFVRKESNLYWKEPLSVAEVRSCILRRSPQLIALCRRRSSDSRRPCGASMATTL